MQTFIDKNRSNPKMFMPQVWNSFGILMIWMTKSTLKILKFGYVKLERKRKISVYYLLANS